MMQPAAECAAASKYFGPPANASSCRPSVFQRCRSREQPACLAAQRQTQLRRQFACRYFGHPELTKALYVFISLQRQELVELRGGHHLLVQLRRELELPAVKALCAQHRLQLLQLFLHGLRRPVLS